jgi:hypothetical protein
MQGLTLNSVGEGSLIGMAVENIHEQIGWFTFANMNCRRSLEDDHVTVITTTHMRRFCSVDCVAEGLVAWREHRTDPPLPPHEGDRCRIGTRRGGAPTWSLVNELTGLRLLRDASD